MVLADAIAIAIGAVLGARLPERPVKIGAAIALVVFGALLNLRGPQVVLNGWGASGHSQGPSSLLSSTWKARNPSQMTFDPWLSDIKSRHVVRH
jgi:amino acid transporter